MYKHHDPAPEGAEPKPGEQQPPSVEQKLHGEVTAPKSAEPSLGSIRELLEKNLKWSQIIYEQNRKINRKLMWAAVAGWLRLLIIVLPLVIGIILLIPLFKQFNCVLQGTQCGPRDQASFESLLKLLPLNQAQQNEIKQMIK